SVEAWRHRRLFRQASPCCSPGHRLLAAPHRRCPLIDCRSLILPWNLGFLTCFGLSPIPCPAPCLALCRILYPALCRNLYLALCRTLCLNLYLALCRIPYLAPCQIPYLAPCQIPYPALYLPRYLILYLVPYQFP